MKSTVFFASFAAVLGVVSAAQVTLYDVDGAQVTPTPSQDKEIFIPIGTGVSDTTYLDEVFKSVYTVQGTDGAVATVTSSTVTLKATVVASASGFKMSRLPTSVPGENGGYIECTVDGKGGAGCSGQIYTGTKTITVQKTGAARTNAFTLSQPTIGPDRAMPTETTAPVRSNDQGAAHRSVSINGFTLMVGSIVFGGFMVL